MSEETDDDRIVASVRAHGWHSIAVDESKHSPRFTYSIGLCHTLDHPDAIVFGLEGRVGYGVLAAVVEDARVGKSYAAPGLYHGVLAGWPIAVRPVHPTQHEVYLGFAMGYYREIGDSDLLRAIQLFWPDKSGLFPFDLACDPLVASLQPRLELPRTGKRRRARTSAPAVPPR